MRTKLLVAFVVIAAVLWFFLREGNNTMGNDLEMKASNTSSWTEIKISNGNTLLSLSKDKDIWYIDNNLEASDKKVKSLVKYLSSLSVRYPLTGPKGESVKKEIEETGFNIQGFVDGKSVYQVYLKKEGNIYYSYVEGSKYPNVLYNSDADESFLSAELVIPKFWRNKTIISLEKDAISEVNLNWLNEGDSFSIKQSNKGELSFTASLEGNFDESIAHFYLYEFKHVEFSRRIVSNKNNTGDLICSLSITEKNGKKHQVQFYQFIDENEVSKSEILLHVVELEEWGIVSFIQVDAILRKASFFLKK